MIVLSVVVVACTPQAVRVVVVVFHSPWASGE